MGNRNLVGTDAARGYANAAGTPYSIDITMSAATVDALTEGDYGLYLFKAVASANSGGSPVVWATTSEYSAHT